MQSANWMPFSMRQSNALHSFIFVFLFIYYWFSKKNALHLFNRRNIYQFSIFKYESFCTTFPHYNWSLIVDAITQLERNALRSQFPLLSATFVFFFYFRLKFMWVINERLQWSIYGHAIEFHDDWRNLPISREMIQKKRRKPMEKKNVCTSHESCLSSIFSCRCSSINSKRFVCDKNMTNIWFLVTFFFLVEKKRRWRRRKKT